MAEKKMLAACVRNDGYSVSLERRKMYEILDDPDAERHGQVRVIDESGEGYLYPADYFVRLDLPRETEKAVIGAA